jgi:hypothetical protein
MGEVKTESDVVPAESKPEEAKPAESSEGIRKVKFVYNRSNYYREIISNGAFGNVSPDLDIHVSFFSQHAPDFQEQIFEVTEQGTLGPEIKEAQPKEMKEIHREVEIGVTMNVPAAIQLVRWLKARIQEASKTLGIEPPEDIEDDKPTASN